MAKLKQLTESEMLKYKKRFMKLNEYSFVNQEEDLLLDEADDETENMGNPQNQGSQNQQPPQDGMEPSMPDGNDQMQGGNEMPMPDDNAQMPMPGGEMQDNSQNPLPMEAEPDMGVPQENEIEIDVTDLTQKQDDIDAKISSVSTETASMVDMLDNLSKKIEDIINKTDSEMSKIKDEIVKRNPTPVEVLQKRITVSDPFSQTPEDYWKKKEAEGHYKLSDDEEEMHVLKGSDIDDNAREIYKSFGLNDDEMNQSLSTMFRI